MRLRWHVALVMVISVILLSVLVQANEEIVEFRLQRARCLCGVVTVSGNPVKNAKVEEFGPDWKEMLRSTDTDAEGRFTLPPIKGRKIYYLQISARATGVKPLRIPIKVVRFRGVSLLHLQLYLA